MPCFTVMFPPADNSPDSTVPKTVMSPFAVTRIPGSMFLVTITLPSKSIWPLLTSTSEMVKISSTRIPLGISTGTPAVVETSSSGFVFDISAPSPATNFLFSPGLAGSMSPTTVNPSLPGVAGCWRISTVPGSTLASLPKSRISTLPSSFIFGAFRRSLRVSTIATNFVAVPSAGRRPLARIPFATVPGGKLNCLSKSCSKKACL